MSDDIVTRLRECICHEGFVKNNRVDPKCDHDGLRADAADEIERLRTELAHAQSEVARLERLASRE